MMKKQLLLFLLCLAWITGYSQETPPPVGPNFKLLSTSQFYIQLPDSAIWQYKGAAGGGWAKMGRYRDVRLTNTRVDSLVVAINMVNGNTPRLSARTSPASLGVSTTITIPELINKYIDEVKIGGGNGWRVDASASETNKTVTFNSVTGTITFPIPIYDFVWAWYRNTTPLPLTTNGVVTVQNYDDIMTHSTWGGPVSYLYTVLTDFKNMDGKKGLYIYIPSVTITPSQIAAYFND